MHRRARLGLGYLTQEPSIFRKLTVEQNILAILETCKLRRQERAIRLKYLLDELDLTGLAAIRLILSVVAKSGVSRLHERWLPVQSCSCWMSHSVGSILSRFMRCKKLVRRLKERGMGILITDHLVREP